MGKKFDPSRVDAIAAKVKAGVGGTATYATSRLKSIFQSKAASQPRQDSLQKIIIDIVRNDPEVGEAKLLRELRNHEHGGVIESIADDTIEFTHNGKAKDSPVSGLKDRLSHAKEFVKNSR